MTCLHAQVQGREKDTQVSGQSTGMNQGGGRGASVCSASDCQAHPEPVSSRAGDPTHAGMGRGPQRRTKVQLQETEARDSMVSRQKAMTSILDFLVLLGSQRQPPTAS